MADAQATIDKVNGFQVAGVSAGLKKDAKLDFALIVSDRPCVVAGVFTTNQVKAAPVLVDMKRVRDNPQAIRAVAINTRSANACTGQQGIDNAHSMARYAAQKIGCAEDQVLVMSTGVIGMQLPIEKILNGVDLAAESLGNDWLSTAMAIMTTDTRPKMASINVTTANGKTYTIAGISKGAGMIAPNMATMLGTIVTDAAVSVEQVQTALKSASELTFNRIVVDGDMSTNDTVLLLANGASGTLVKSSQDEAQFQDALNVVCKKLAQDIVRDGEGVTKFITLRVTGTADGESARQIANAIATSPLVKTAFFGGDANWGRIVAAAGRAGVPLQPEKMRLWIAKGELPKADLLIFESGMPTQYSEAEATAIFKNDSISVLLDCGLGDGSATVWTCDLSHDYVSINGDYRS
jgi:glutamate N-acetyltransferase/amino-acid N-acetyltransferase